MAESILTSTKKMLGLAEDYTPFDLEIVTHINAAFSILNQLGVGPEEGFMIEDETPTWDDFMIVDGSGASKNLIKSYMYLKVRSMFDPPTTSFHLEAMNEQIQQYEWRLNVSREYAIYPVEVE